MNRLVKDGFRTTNQPNLIKASQCRLRMSERPKKTREHELMMEMTGCLSNRRAACLQARQAKPAQARRETTHKTTKVGFTYRVVHYLFTNWFVLLKSIHLWKTPTNFFFTCYGALLKIGLWNLNSAIYPITSTTLGSTLKKAIEWAIAVLSNT